MKERPKKTLWQEFKKNPPLYIGLFLVFVLLLMAFFPSLFTSLSPTDIVAEAKLSPPSKEHIFGTDVYGRDVFARCVYGTIVDLKIGVIAMIVPLIMGTIIGLLAGYYGGKFDMIVVMDDRNYEHVHRLAPSRADAARIFRMREFFSRHPGWDHVPDPYYEGHEGFELVLDLLEDACEGLLDDLKNPTRS